MAEEPQPKEARLALIPDHGHVHTQPLHSGFHSSLPVEEPKVPVSSFGRDLFFRRNMGRYFLLILLLTTLGKVNILVQELFFDDLSVPFYEIKNEVPNSEKSLQTRFC